MEWRFTSRVIAVRLFTTLSNAGAIMCIARTIVARRPAIARYCATSVELRFHELHGGDCQSSGTDRRLECGGGPGPMSGAGSDTSRNSWVKPGWTTIARISRLSRIAPRHRQRRAPGLNRLGARVARSSQLACPQSFRERFIRRMELLRHSGRSVKSLHKSVQLQFSIRGGDVEQGTQRGARSADASSHDASTAGHCGSIRHPLSGCQMPSDRLHELDG